MLRSGEKKEYLAERGRGACLGSPCCPPRLSGWAGPHAARPKALRLVYLSSMNCVTTVRVSPFASISVQIAV